MKATITHIKPQFTITHADNLTGNGEAGPMQYALTVETPTGGTIETNPAAGTHPEGTIITMKATPATGYRFVQILINTIANLSALTYTKLTQAKTIAAQFIAQYTLTTSVSGNGTISPLGSNVYDDGTVVDITVTPDPENEIDRVEEDGTPISAPYQVTTNANKGVIAYFRALANLVQQFFIGSDDIIGNELVDHTLNANATIYGRYFDGSSSIIPSFLAIRVPIPIDWSTDGLKYEVITSLAVGADRNQLVTTADGWPYGLYVSNTAIGTRLIGSDSLSKFITFSTMGFPADNSLHRFKIVVNGSTATCYKTTPEDEYYSEAITEDFDLSTLTNLRVVNDDTVGGQAGFRLKGDLKLFNINGHEFTFEEGVVDRCFSTTTQNSLSIGIYTSRMDNWTSQFCAAKKGFTRVYYSDKILTVPYNNGVSNITNIIAEINALFPSTNVAYEEFPEGYFGNGYAIKLDPSIEPYDYNNTYFDELSNAKFITAKEQPTKLDNRIYFTREGNILIYDVGKTILSPKNLVGKKCLWVGDSTAASSSPIYLADMTGLDMTVKSYSGKITSEIETLLKADEVGEPTLISDKDEIILLCGFNDFNLDTTVINFTTASDSIISYLRSVNPTADIIVCLLYDFKYLSGSNPNPTGDPNQENAGGLTYNLIRSIFTSSASMNSAITSNLNNIGFDTDIDTVDGLHPTPPTGSKKIADKVKLTLRLLE